MSSIGRPPFIFLAREDLPSLGVKRGDQLLVRPGAAVPVIVRSEGIADYAAIAGAFAAGDLELLSTDSDGVRAFLSDKEPESRRSRLRLI